MANIKIRNLDSASDTQITSGVYIASALNEEEGTQEKITVKATAAQMVSGGAVYADFSEELLVSGVPVSTGSSAGSFEGGAFNFGSKNAANNTNVVNFNQGENVRMYIDEGGGVNISEKLIVADGKETVLGGATIVKETFTVANGKQTTLGGPVTIKGDSTFEQSAIFTNLTNDPAPPDGKLYRKGNDLYFGGQKILTEGQGGKWVDGTTAGQIHYSGGNVGIGTSSPTNGKLHIDTAVGTTNGLVLDTHGGDSFRIFGGNTDKIHLVRGEHAAKGITIDNAGQVGIAAQNPNAKLSVFTSATPGSVLSHAIFHQGIEVNSGGDALIDIKSTHADGTNWRLLQVVSDGDKGRFHIGHTANQSLLTLTKSNMLRFHGGTDGNIQISSIQGRAQIQSATNNYSTNTDLGLGMNGQALLIKGGGNADTTTGYIGIGLGTPSCNIDAKPTVINAQSQFIARFATENSGLMYHSQLKFSKCKADGTYTDSGSIMGSVIWEGKDTNNTVRSCGMIKIVQRGAASTSGRITDMYFHTSDGALYGPSNDTPISNDPRHEKLRLKGGGGMILPRLSGDPSSADNGEMYYNTSTNKFRGYQNGTWVNLA